MLRQPCQKNYKVELRKQFLALRNAISQVRRVEASRSIVETLQTKGRILSFYSIKSEIDLSVLNSILAQSGRLMALCLEGENLAPYHVQNEQELVVSPLGIREPDPTTARKAFLSEIDLILVPGLAFDREGYRLGYGKGHYDKFLASTGNIPTAGVGFREQLSPDLLPRDPWDIPLNELILV